MTTHKKFTLNDGSVLEIIHDDSPESPREWGNNGIMVCFHGNYNLGDYKDHDYKSADYDGWDGLRKQIEEDHDVVVILPLYLYDHSGITIATTPFGCRWDSGQVGWIFASRKSLKEGGHADDVDVDKVKTWLKGEVETYDQYLRGDIFGYQLYAPPPSPCETCGHVNEAEEIDACWGFYGDDILTNGMLDHFTPEQRAELEALAKL